MKSIRDPFFFGSLPDSFQKYLNRKAFSRQVEGAVTGKVSQQCAAETRANVQREVIVLESPIWNFVWKTEGNCLQCIGGGGSKATITARTVSGR